MNIFKGILSSFRDIFGNCRSVKLLSGFCILVYILQLIAAYTSEFFYYEFGIFVDYELRYLFGLSTEGFLSGYIWQPITYAFMHGSFTHLFFNLFTLVFIGGAIESALGEAKFWLIFFLSSIIGGLGWLLFDYYEPQIWYKVASSGELGLQLAQRWGEQQIYGISKVCVGASGGIFGLVGAFVALFPREKLTLLLFFVIPLKLQARVVALVLVILTLVELVISFDNIAYAAHLGGGIAGYLVASRIRHATRMKNEE